MITNNGTPLKRLSGKLMATNCEGIILLDYSLTELTLNEKHYSNLLKGPMTQALIKSRGKLPEWLLLQHDTARPRAAQMTKKTLENLK